MMTSEKLIYQVRKYTYTDACHSKKIRLTLFIITPNDHYISYYIHLSA